MPFPLVAGLFAKGAAGFAKKGAAKLLGGLFGRGSRRQRYQAEEPMYQPEPYQFQAAQIEPFDSINGLNQEYEMEEQMNYNPRRKRGFY